MGDSVTPVRWRDRRFWDLTLGATLGLLAVTTLWRWSYPQTDYAVELIFLLLWLAFAGLWSVLFVVALLRHRVRDNALVRWVAPPFIALFMAVAFNVSLPDHVRFVASRAALDAAADAALAHERMPSRVGYYEIDRVEVGAREVRLWTASRGQGSAVLIRDAEFDDWLLVCVRVDAHWQVCERGVG